MMDFSVEDQDQSLAAINPTVIKILGCGGGGSSAVNRMIKANVQDVEFIVLNTDKQALAANLAPKKLPIGQKLTGGLGAGGNPEVGENAAKEDAEAIKNILDGANMAIITAGMGGGTGTGSAPIVAGIAKDAGILTIAVVTTPFDFEGKVRMRNAQEGLAKLRKNVDSLIVIPNQQIMKIADKNLNYRQAFTIADDVLCQGVQGISEIITKPGDINLDFADVKSIMKDQGDAILGVGFGEGENRAVDAAQSAISNPMLENRQIDGATKILVNITAAEDLGMTEVDEIVNNIKASASPEAEVIVGLVNNPEMEGKVSVTVIATGFDAKPEHGFDADDSDSRKQKEEDSNVMDYGTFDRYTHSTKNNQDSEIEESDSVSAVSGRFSSIAPEAGTLFGNLDDEISDKSENEEPAEENMDDLESRLRSLNKPVSSSIEPPGDYNIRQDDLSQPAVWRKLKNNLSRSINLTDDK